jgi:hypothetical protein
MPVLENDWRIQGQERYLRGAVLRRTRWARPRPSWDHDHCAFCWARFADGGRPRALRDGWTTPDRRHWVCPRCFEDFRETFGWTVGEA